MIKKNQKNIEYVHNIYISNEEIEYKSLPSIVKDNIKSVRDLYNDSSYLFWQESDIRSFLKKNFEEDVLKAFDLVQAFALKADLARYCILYVYGGLYSDLSNRFISKINLKEDTRILAFKDRYPMHGSSWMIQNTIIYAEKLSDEIKKLIYICVDNINNRFYGNSSLEPTGPALFGRVISIFSDYRKYNLGISLNFDQTYNRSHYIDENGTLVAVRLQGGGGKPSELGLKNTNSYGSLWDSKQLFGENQIIYKSDNAQIFTKLEKKSDNIKINYFDKGIVIYGPNVALYEGTYRVSLYIEDEGILTLSKIDVCALGGKKILYKEKFFLKRGELSFSFNLDTYYPDIEVRIKTYFGSKFSFKSMKITGDKLVNSRAPSEKETKNNYFKEKNIEYIHIFDNDLLDYEKRMKILEMYPSSFLIEWNDLSIDKLIYDHFDRHIYDFYVMNKNNYYSRVISKLCILYLKGGIFLSEIGTIISPIIINDNIDLYTFINVEKKEITINENIIYSKKFVEEIKLSINMFIKNKLDEVNDLCLGSVLIKTMSLQNRTKNYCSGRYLFVSKDSSSSYYSYIGSDGRIISINRE